MFPRRPILLGGFALPHVVWFASRILEMVDPVLNQRIDWFWFVLSQVGFGIVAGIVFPGKCAYELWQHLPFPIRLG